VIPVVLVAEPPSFEDHVRKRGKDVITRLSGKPVKGKGGPQAEEDLCSRRSNPFE